MDNYGVIGNPIAHSQSPRIHGLFAEQTSQALTYRAIFSHPDEFTATVEAFRQSGGRGLNVTLPFKEQAWQYVNHSTARADRVKAVNLIRFDAPDRVHGDSTDGAGLIRDLANNRMAIKNKRVLLIGAGGAVRSVLGSLIDEEPAAITIVNRTRSRAEQLIELFPEAGGLLDTRGFDELAGNSPDTRGFDELAGNSPDTRGFDELAGSSYDLVINGTSAGLAGSPLPLPDSILAPGACCYDMAYGPASDLFLDWAANNGAANSSDGLGMLVEQAAESFYLWRGIHPETQPVIDALR